MNISIHSDETIISYEAAIGSCDRVTYILYKYIVNTENLVFSIILDVKTLA